MEMLNLRQFDIDPASGFLANPDPLTTLPDYFIALDRLGRELPALICAGRVRERADALPLLDIARLERPGECERALLLYATCASAYVWGGEEPRLRLPRSLAEPLWLLAEALGRQPIIHYASNALNNWRRIDADGPIELGNLAMIQGFLSSSDESWFYLVSVAVEQAGLPALGLLCSLHFAVELADVTLLVDSLTAVAKVIEAMSGQLLRMYENCDPHIFFKRVRPFVASWPYPGVIYTGVSETPLKLAGASAGQSSLIQALDASLGVRHHSNSTQPFLAAMRAYMPPNHRRFLSALESCPSVHQFVGARGDQYPILVEAYNSCIHRLAEFRRHHMEMAARYITMQGSEGREDIGTGGTSVSTFLGAARRETREYRV